MRYLARQARRKWLPPGHRDSERGVAPSLFRAPVRGYDGPAYQNPCRRFRSQRCSLALAPFWVRLTLPWRRPPNLVSGLLDQALPRLDDRESWRFPSRPCRRQDLFWLQQQIPRWLSHTKRNGASRRRG